MACTRRALLRGLAALPWLAVCPIGQGCGGAPEGCVDRAALSASEERMRAAVGYTDVSPHGDPKQCSGCSFFEPRGDGRCGHCTILSGAVDAGGHCQSWSRA